jgi:hypothetical protein
MADPPRYFRIEMPRGRCAKRTRNRPLGRYIMAEREGFEPSIRCDPYTRFPSVLLQPLGHLSAETGFSSRPSMGRLQESMSKSGRLEK